MIILVLTFVLKSQAQFGNHTAFATVDFTDVRQTWDGFGFNYVESCKTVDYENHPQDLGGFTILDNAQKNEIIDLIFGEQGLRPSIIKMFLDPWHLDSQTAQPEGTRCP